MIAPRVLPPEFIAWNQRWGAPFGRKWPLGHRLRDTNVAMRYRGPFAYQTNAETREYEYPWAFAQVTALKRPLRIVEIGGGLSGMQFVLGSMGHQIINVDPGADAQSEWAFDTGMHARLCRLFRAPVRLVPTGLDQAGLDSQSADVILCVSVLEHLPPDELARCLRAVRAILKPDGLAVFTVDLFLDLAPFQAEEYGRWGRNVNVQHLLRTADLELVSGNPRELFGFEEFNPVEILSRSEQFLVGKARSTAQCLTARIARPTTRG